MSHQRRSARGAESRQGWWAGQVGMIGRVQAAHERERHRDRGKGHEVAPEEDGAVLTRQPHLSAFEPPRQYLDRNPGDEDEGDGGPHGVRAVHARQVSERQHAAQRGDDGHDSLAAGDRDEVLDWPHALRRASCRVSPTGAARNGELVAATLRLPGYRHPGQRSRAGSPGRTSRRPTVREGAVGRRRVRPDGPLRGGRSPRRRASPRVRTGRSRPHGAPARPAPGTRPSRTAQRAGSCGAARTRRR